MPIHDAHQPMDDEVSASLAAVEALTNGVTTVVEAGTVAHVDRVAGALADAGLRATIGVWGWDIEDGPYTAPTHEVLDRQRSVVDAYPSGGLVEGWVTLVGHDLASDDLLAGGADLARELATGMTMHLSPTSSDPQRYLERTNRRPVEHLADLGVLGRHLLIGHGVWLDDAEVDLILSTRDRHRLLPVGVSASRPRRVRAAVVTRRSSNAADGSRWVATPRTRRTRSTSSAPQPPASGIARDARLDPDAFRRSPGLRAGDDRRRGGDRDGRPHRIARGRQAGRHRHPSHATRRGGRHVAMSGCSWCGAPTGAASATCSSPGGRWSRGGRVTSIDLDALAIRRGRSPTVSPRTGRHHRPEPLAAPRRTLTDMVGGKHSSWSSVASPPG